ncbi:quinone-oxidoreductase QR2-like [Phragmites australis]|uniref:quinone-oxidoreductase QR2-like n=1 Tax=Phragmites australis TaxID=29695 RepID=UPI002D79EB7D|nr:quinone-oxidoreductase QR2-like [Phragmites australis]
MATKIYIVYYSTWGHVATLAEEIKKAADSVDGVEATIWQVPETLPEEVLGKMHAAPKREDHPVISARQLTDADGVLFGFPTRFGMMAAQMKAFLDSTGGLWQQQALAGKPAGFFFATGTQGGGQETTALTAVTQLAHHGMLFVPVGYTLGAGMFGMDEVKGGSPYGAGTFAGADGSRMPSVAELAMAAHQGKYFAGIAKKLKAGAALA